MTLRRFDLVGFGPALGVGVTGARYVRLQAVAKTNGPDAPYCLPNEIVCAELGRFLRLPVPPCALVRPPGPGHPVWFASLDFNLTGESLPPVDPGQCYAALPRECAGVLLFDLLVANGDRHAENLAADYSAKPARLAVFDHSHALFGATAGGGVERLAGLRGRLGMSGGAFSRGDRHCLLDTLTDDKDFAGWLERIRCIPDFLIDELTEDVGGYGVAPGERQAVREFLRLRRESLPEILQNYRTEFTAIKQWSLFS